MDDATRKQSGREREGWGTGGRSSETYALVSCGWRGEVVSRAADTPGWLPGGGGAGSGSNSSTPPPHHPHLPDTPPHPHTVTFSWQLAVSPPFPCSPLHLITMHP
ncbi:hypothetical protein E2C01_056089 [Portunus trituberculatus]|uniref:Uncharacterized protein n=1 Tax=Portunus trituberculatus TaxID=210409 RepID=A0A5B7GPG5_PORTR|nr:hypothetical protein [Portunus trituberculatus]